MTCERSLKTWPHFRKFNYKKNLKSKNENWKGFATSKLHTLFTGGKKLWQKPETICVIDFLSKLVLSKASMKQLTKAALALRLGKFIFFRTRFKMNIQLDTLANHEKRRKLLSSPYTLNLSTSTAQVCFT